VEDSKKVLFQKFINNECSPAEVEQMLEYLHASEEEIAYKDLMDEVWEKLKEYPQVGKEEKEQQFKIILERSKKERGTKVRPMFRKYSVQIAAAACIGLLLVSGLVYLLFLQSPDVIHQTTFGETEKIILPDGSKVTLNSNSMLSYQHSWDEQKTREVTLKGEAFFSVVHTLNDQKFFVRTNGEVSVEVLGTRFNVNNRHKTTEVVLNEGKVKVNIITDTEKQEVLMEPGELMAYSQITHQYQKKLIDTKVHTSWKDNMLIFENQSLQEIALILEDNYGYTVQFADNTIGAYQFTGTIPTDKVEALFTMLAKSFDLKIENDGKEIWIKPNE